MLIQRSLVEAECRTRKLGVNPPEHFNCNMETVRLSGPRYVQTTWIVSWWRVQRSACE